MELKRDSHLGRYNIRSHVGEGGMGVVYRAYDEQLRRQVAIKTIQGDKASDREFLTRFKREALAISQIDHPHIVRIFDFVDAANGQPSYMVMELLKGKDLGRIIAEQGPLAFFRAVDRILEVCAAVGECHRRGYVHRDLKPTNIFLAEYDQIETAKVLDFGAAKQEEQRERRGDDSELTTKGTFLGTPYYMPPEQLMGKPATAKSDQYSLAVVLYTAVTGQKPFEIDKDKEFKDWELLQAIKQGEYTAVQKLRPDVPGGLADAIHKAMNVDPAKRFVDLHAFGAELRAFASPQAKLTWEAFFTLSPTKRVPQRSIAIMADDVRPKTAAALDDPANVDQADPTLPPQTPLTGPDEAFAEEDEGQQTIPISTAELKGVSGELSYATTTKRPSDLPSASISIAIDEASQAGEALQTDRPSKRTPSQTTGKSLFRNRSPALIVLGAVVLFAGVLLAAFVITHEKGPPPAVPQPPAAMFAQPLAAPTPVPRAVTAAAAGPQPSPPPAAPTAPTTASTPPSELNAVPIAAKRHAHKKTKQPLLDTHGIPIPTD